MSDAGSTRPPSRPDYEWLTKTLIPHQHGLDELGALNVVEQYEAEVARLEQERDEYRATNEAVRVCAAHTRDVVGPPFNCLVCEVAALREALERIARGDVVADLPAPMIARAALAGDKDNTQ